MFIYPYTWSFYTASVLVGIGAAGNETLTSNTFFLKTTKKKTFLHVYMCLFFTLLSSAVDGSGKCAHHQLQWLHNRKKQWHILGSAAVQVKPDKHNKSENTRGTETNQFNKYIVQGPLTFWGPWPFTFPVSLELCWLFFISAACSLETSTFTVSGMDTFI